MADAEKVRRKGPRGTRAEVEAVVRSAEEAGRELDREQEESAGLVAQTLGEITEGETFANLEARIAFLERQVERLAARRDEADRGVQAELAVMRARIEEALEAVGLTSQEHREARAALDKRVLAASAEADRRAAGMVDTLRQEVVAKVQEAATRFERVEARLRGEMKAFEAEADERGRAAGAAIAQDRAAVESALASVQGSVEEAVGPLRRRVEEAVAAQAGSARAEAEMRSALEEVARTAAEAGARAAQAEDAARAGAASLGAALAGLREELQADAIALRERLASLAAESSERSAAADAAAERVAALEASMQQAAARLEEALERQRVETEARTASVLDAERAAMTELLERERRELDGLLSEWKAEIRIEAQRMWESMESRWKVTEARLEAAGGNLEALRRELLDRVRASEEKAAGAALHLESMVREHHRQMVSDEQEWSQALGGVGQDLSAARVRLEELMGRVASVEARWATERGGSSAAMERIVTRLDLLEEQVRGAVDEALGRQATRLEMLGSQVAGLAESELIAEERLGAVEYLKRRVAELADRVERIGAGQGLRTAPPGDPAPLAPAGAERLAEVEQGLQTLERSLAGESAAVSDLQQKIAARLEELERRASLGPTILPERRRRRI